MTLPHRAHRRRLSGLALPLADRDDRTLTRAGWTPTDVDAARALCGPDTGDVLAGAARGEFPDRTPATVLAWLRAGGEPLLQARRDPALRRRQAASMAGWSRTYGALGPAAHAAGLGLSEAAGLLAAGELTAEGLAARSTGTPPAAVLESWSDALRASA